MPPGVMSELPDEAVALEKLREPWDGAEVWDHVNVCPESVSLTWRRLTMLVADAFSETVSVVVLPTKVGVVLGPWIDNSDPKDPVTPEVPEFQLAELAIRDSHCARVAVEVRPL